MIRINCDIGEREPDNKTDIELMKHIHIANIACGGHAGDEETVAVFRRLAKEYNVGVAAHLSYPDKENFGRVSMDISEKNLLKALDEQYKMMPDVKMVKFHGGLYNDCAGDKELARLLADWLSENSIEAVITPDKSEMAKAASVAGIRVISEAFAERAYNFDPGTGRLSLVSRAKKYACIHDCEAAVAHSEMILKNGVVEAYVDTGEGDPKREKAAINAETICIHSDSVIALELASRLADLNRQ